MKRAPLTNDDVQILLRRYDRFACWLDYVTANAADSDELIMLARTVARQRGATPAQIQRNVAALDSDDPKDCLPRVGWQ